MSVCRCSWINFGGTWKREFNPNISRSSSSGLHFAVSLSRIDLRSLDRAFQLCVYCCLMLIRTPDIFVLRNVRARYSLSRDVYYPVYAYPIAYQIRTCHERSICQYRHVYIVGKFWIRTLCVLYIFASYVSLHFLNSEKRKFVNFCYLWYRDVIFVYRSIAFLSVGTLSCTYIR